MLLPLFTYQGFFCVRSTVRCFALSSQFALVTFVRLFSTVCFQMHPQIALHTDYSLRCVIFFIRTVHCALLDSVTNLQTAQAWLRSNLATHRGLETLEHSLIPSWPPKNTHTHTRLKTWIHMKMRRPLSWMLLWYWWGLGWQVWWCILWRSRPLLFASVSYNALLPHPPPHHILHYNQQCIALEQMRITHKNCDNGDCGADTVEGCQSLQTDQKMMYCIQCCAWSILSSPTLR